jgi:hypothetical protein
MIEIVGLGKGGQRAGLRADETELTPDRSRRAMPLAAEALMKPRRFSR